MTERDTRGLVIANIVLAQEEVLRSLDLIDWRLAHVRHIPSASSKAFGLFVEDPIKLMLLRSLHFCSNIVSKMHAVSPYDDPAMVRKLRRVGKRIEKVISEQGIEKSTHLLLTSWPIGSFAAYALEDYCGYRAAIIYDGIFHFAQAFSNVLTGRIEANKNRHSFKNDYGYFHGDLFVTYPNDANLAVKLTELLQATLIGGDPYNARPFETSPVPSHLQHEILNIFELFVVGHEYGHCIKHTDKVSSSQSVREFEADEFALDTVLRIIRHKSFRISYPYTNNPVIAFAGVDLFFLSAEICFKAAAVFDQTYLLCLEQSIDYPSLAQRRSSLLTSLKAKCGKRVSDETETYCALIRETAYRMFEKSKQSLYRDKEMGLGLHPLWANPKDADWYKAF